MAVTIGGLGCMKWMDDSLRARIQIYQQINKIHHSPQHQSPSLQLSSNLENCRPNSIVTRHFPKMTATPMWAENCLQRTPIIISRTIRQTGTISQAITLTKICKHHMFLTTGIKPALHLLSAEACFAQRNIYHVIILHTESSQHFWRTRIDQGMHYREEHVDMWRRKILVWHAFGGAGTHQRWDDRGSCMWHVKREETKPSYRWDMNWWEVIRRVFWSGGDFGPVSSWMLTLRWDLLSEVCGK
jgi:hypothetical protein